MCVHFVTCPKQGLEMEAVVLHRVGFLAYFCPKQGQDFKSSAVPLYPNMGQVPPPPRAFDVVTGRDYMVRQSGSVTILCESLKMFSLPIM